MGQRFEDSLVEIFVWPIVRSGINNSKMETTAANNCDGGLAQEYWLVIWVQATTCGGRLLPLDTYRSKIDLVVNTGIRSKPRPHLLGLEACPITIGNISPPRRYFSQPRSSRVLGM